MKRLIVALLVTSLLGGCFPMAMFAGTGPAYNSYRQNWGTYVASRSVDTFCLSPKLRFAIWDFEGKFGKKIVANSGYRSPEHNAAVGGAERSMHMRCMAADFFIPGVSKQRLIAFAMRNRLVGGLGCYPGSNFIHIDVRERPRGWNRPITFGGGC